MPTNEIETLRVHDLLTTIYINLKEIRDTLNSEPIHQAWLFAEFIGWTEVMIELLTMIVIHRDLHLPDDAPSDLLTVIACSTHIGHKENSPPQDLELAGCEIIDRLGDILSIPLVYFSPDPAIHQEPPRENKAKGFLSFFRARAPCLPSLNEPSPLVVETKF